MGKYANEEKRKAYERKKSKSRAHDPHKMVGDVLRSAVYSGKIVRPTECSSCGGSGRIEGHHKDYSRPYDVIWLCQKCHQNLHKTQFIAWGFYGGRRKKNNKINFDVAQQIRKEYQVGSSQKTLSEKYGITTQFVGQVIHNRWYKNQGLN